MLQRRIGRAVLGVPRPWQSSARGSSSAFSTSQRARLATNTTTTTSSTSTDPRAPAVPFHPQQNPHAATPHAATIAPLPGIRTEPSPSPFLLAAARSTLPPVPPPTTAANAGPLPSAVAASLPTLAAQPPHYAMMLLHGHPYLVTQGDRVRLPFRMPGVEPGDVLRLTSAQAVGSRDYTLRGAPHVDARTFVCRAVVVGVEAEPMRVMEKTTRRNRRVKHVRSKHRYTELVIRELRVRTLEEIAQDETAGEDRQLRAGEGERTV